MSELLKKAGIKAITESRDTELSGVSSDSRSTRKGDVFIAVRGEGSDGHDYAGEAVRNGAAAVVAERRLDIEAPCVIVEDSAATAGLIASAFYGHPSRDMAMVGVTGTNGKTSTAFLIRSILRISAGKTGIIGTVGFGGGDEMASCERTTPDAVDLNRKLADFRDSGCKAVVMEVSSHSTVQGRINGVEFDVGVFTNISRDHLDYHATFDRYLEAKKIFIDSLTSKEREKGPGMLVYNIEDPRVNKIGEDFEGRRLSFGTEKGSGISALNIEAGMNGTGFELSVEGVTTPVRLKLLGAFSVLNALAAAGAAHLLGAGQGEIKEGLESVANVPGRFQVVSGRGGPTVVVDYAHTPDALENILSFCVGLKPDRVITVFGCGGDRDRGKRPIMGEIASRLSDIVYVTNDNPRTEDPEGIIDDILTGIEEAGDRVRVVSDRRQAIREAVIEADKGDIVLIAGKGHEEVQIIGDRKIRFSDAEEAGKAFRSWEVGHQN